MRSFISKIQLLDPRSRIALLLTFFLFCFCLAAVLQQFYSHVFFYYDLGIYSDALYRLRNWSDLNPIIPGRALRIFNDHFDPILIPFAPLTHLIPAPLLGIGLEFLTFLLLLHPLFLLYRAQRLSKDGLIFSWAFLSLNHATQNALSWPFHPTTLGNLPLFYLFTFFVLNQPRATLISFLALSLTREEFPLIGLFLAPALWLKQHRFISSLTAVITILELLFLFKLKPTLMPGPYSTYGQELLAGFLSKPFKNLEQVFSLSFFRMWLERLAPLLVLLPFAIKTKKRITQSVLILLIAAPTLGIRYASHQWGFHYGVAAIVIAYFYFLPLLQTFTFQSRRGLIAILLLLIFSASHSVRMIRHAHSFPESRTEAIHQAQKQTQSLPPSRILTNNNLAATQLYHTPFHDVHILGGPRLDSEPFDVVLVEKPPRGDVWLIGHLRVEQLIQLWKTDPEIQTLIDDEWIYFAKGKVRVDR